MFRTNATANLPLCVKNAKDNGKNCRADSNRPSATHHAPCRLEVRRAKYLTRKGRKKFWNVIFKGTNRCKFPTTQNRLCK